MNVNTTTVIIWVARENTWSYPAPSTHKIVGILSISENTVEYHPIHAYDKLGVCSRSELVARFFRETYWAGA